MKKSPGPAFRLFPSCFFKLIGGVAFFFAGGLSAATSWLVSPGPDGLVYEGYANEGQTRALNTIPDFSNVGYMGGGVPIPFVPAQVRLTDDGPADDTDRIQDAIDTVSALPPGPDGFRGAVLLEAGEYTVDRKLTLSTSGVVVRGAGSQEDGGTRITFTAKRRENLFEVNGDGDGVSEVPGTRVRITDSFVPVGARTFRVTDASKFAPGDRILVRNTMNERWIDDLPGMRQQGWKARSYQLSFRRVITAVEGDRITIDAPIVQTIQDEYGGGVVFKYTFPGELEQIGFEALRLESTFAAPVDEDHGWVAIQLNRLRDGWVRQVTVRHFGMGAVHIRNNSERITVEDTAMLDHKSMVAGGRRYSFSIDDSQNLLFQRCLTRDGRHDYASGSRTPGPNAFVDCLADQANSDVGPHHRYATGQIYDNVKAGAINVQNRGGGGSGQGWAGAQILFWNCEADSIRCDAPNGAMNWCVGSVGKKSEGGGNEPFGIWDSHGVPVTPRSLYYAQLEDRRGPNALNNVILPRQKTGRIWTELLNWGGDGLFLDPLVVRIDEETPAVVGQPLEVRGIVRDLSMLDRGASVSWRTVYGPGEVAFADPAALETTATFPENGAYLLELSLEDGTSVIRKAVEVRVGPESADTEPPSAPEAFAATATGDSIVLDWKDGAEEDLVGYDLFRSTKEGERGDALVYGLTASEYEDSSVEEGVWYFYTVRAVDREMNQSLDNNQVSASVNAVPGVEFLEPLDGMKVNRGSDLLVSVAATDKGGTIAGVELFVDGERVSQNEPVALQWGGEGQDYPLLQDLALGTYVLEAVVTDDRGASSRKRITIEVIVDVTPPAAPAGLSAEANDGWVRLDWEENSERDFASYSVYRSTEPDELGVLLGEVGVNTFDDTEVANETTYFYTVTATDTSGLVSVEGGKIRATPEDSPPGTIVFGSYNDGAGGFVPSASSETEIWKIREESVQFTNITRGHRNGTLLREVELDRSDGSAYTFEGVVHLTSGYAHDNNRVGLYLFAERDGSGKVDESSGMSLLLNLEGGSVNISKGIARKGLASGGHGRAKDYNWFGEDLTLRVELAFNGSPGGNGTIQIAATLIDAKGTETPVRTTVRAEEFPGRWFGFATRSRCRNYGIEDAHENTPWIMDYKSVRLRKTSGEAD